MELLVEHLITPQQPATRRAAAAYSRVRECRILGPVNAALGSAPIVASFPRQQASTPCQSADDLWFAIGAFGARQVPTWPWEDT
jgi:hypothetical protein